jgi:hypothetical protein
LKWWWKDFAGTAQPEKVIKKSEEIEREKEEKEKCRKTL